MLKYERLVLGEMETNCYLVWDEETKETAIIDPADGGEDISDEIQRLGLKPIVILATHGHFDHVMATLDLKLIFNLPVAVSKLDWFLLERQQETAQHFLKKKIFTPNLAKVDIDLNKVKSIRLGEFKLKLIKTPGHTPGGVCFHNVESGLLFCGDLVFGDGSTGEVSHKYSAPLDLRSSVEKILELNDGTKILAGHGPEGVLYKKKITVLD
jgi:glyoxylase-like metal-dependent hydrolase (beta-lactamase superfamily II)